jgi:hypothetical protein
MTDLINKANSIDQNTIQELQNTYGFLIEVINNKKLLTPIIYTVDIAIKYIKQEHKDLGVDLSGWTIVAIKRLFEKGILKNEEDIPKEVDEFILHYKNNYQSYLNDMVMCSNDYDKECGFIDEYVFKRKN